MNETRGDALSDFFVPFLTAKITTVICHGDKVSVILQNAHSCEGLINVVKIGSPVTAEQSEEATRLGLRLISFRELEVCQLENFNGSFIK